MQVAFLNENTLGHTAYLPAFVRELGKRPELGITPYQLDVTPLPGAAEKRANLSVPVLRKCGLDFHNARWRLAVSRHARHLLEELRSRQHLDAVVVNTQSVGLLLADLAAELPTLVCLDATFNQLAKSPWFAPNAATRSLLPLTLMPLLGRERRLFQVATRLLPWSENARQSLLQDYGVPSERARLLPPSIELPPLAGPREFKSDRPRILFMGGDFQRKGGPLLLECFREQFAGRCELHLVTKAGVVPAQNIQVHRNITPHSAAWREQWEKADVFVFPSSLETFGIVILEAMAYEVPVIASDVGAARQLLGRNNAGWLLPDLSKPALCQAINECLGQPDLARARAQQGRRIIEENFSLALNSARLAEWLRDLINKPASPQG